MIKSEFEDAHTPEWVEKNITDPDHELVILHRIISWEKIAGRLTQFYDKTKGAVGRELRMMTAIVIVSRSYQLSDRVAVRQVKENRYIQYFCNVADQGLKTFLHPSTLCVFRKRIGEKGFAVIEKEVFEVLRRAGVIDGDDQLTDSTVLNSNIIYPNDVQLIYKAFRKMRSIAKDNSIKIWWDDELLKKLWKEFSLSKEKDRGKWLTEFYIMFVSAMEIFHAVSASLRISARRKKKVLKLSNYRQSE